ncbi:ATP-binding protein [Alteromonas sp. 1_MG-2023]|uniref:sensor histidine kinase n=1 Tax=Alteromonas sp. 1_MG-2023 TaxID=3062669 RepID=UPI0026E237F3|nr:ATP-binding protein [Alteromonas sp. 1_MG-2023]MDO6566713.1 ATP-binding protein [Alteromonas sp. 1_MG-2023]
MAERAIKLSIQSLFLWVVMSIATIALVSTSSLSIYSQITTSRHEINSNANLLTRMIASVVSEPLKDSPPSFVEDRLQDLASAEQVLNVHIYKSLPDDSDTFSSVERFASYNKDGQLLIPGKQKQLVTLEQTPMLTEDNEFLESSQKIYDQETNQVLGWVYLRMSAEGFSHKIVKTILVNLGALLVLLIFSLVLAMRFQRKITAPIEKLSFFLQRTSRQRDYSARAEPSNLKEINVLSDDVNIMLSRIQEYMHKQRQAEDQHRKLNASLEEMVSQRTNALKDANQELIQTLEKLHEFQRQIVQNEKMASLGDMVAGVAHEVNTPIGLGVTASTMMLDRLAVIKRDFENKTLKASAMQRFMDESHENLNIIYRNLNRAAELISSFKQVAVDQSSESSRSFCFAQLVNEILLSLQPRLKKLQHNINVECDPTLCVETKAGPINQILINLIMNSVIHGFEDVEKGQIDICAELITANKLKLVYRDNGIGIPSDIRKRIFDPFVTTKRGQGGSGLGMHLVYNLVTQGLNGSITITSEVGSGVEFVIVFPVSNAKTS